MRCKKQFWVENFLDLFCTFDVLPMQDMTLEEQMNAITRVVLLMFLFLFIIDFAHDFLFLVCALLFIIILYYSITGMQKKCREDYGLVDTVIEPVPTVPWDTGTNVPINRTGCGCGAAGNQQQQGRTMLHLNPNNSNNPSDSLRWCPNEVPIEATVSQNQRLVGAPNPKTLVQPVLGARAYDFQVWAPNDFVIPTFLNEDRRQELYQNGYVPASSSPPAVVESYDYMTYDYPSVDRTCGYDPRNLEHNLPINYNADTCEKTPGMTEYNKNLYTIPLQPNINTFSQVNQPYASMSNLGISMATPFLPTTFVNGNTFVEQAPGDGSEDPSVPPPDSPTHPLRSDIYDPRYTGYGTNYRNYIDPMTGQPRFFYDDIDSQVQPNYITRNNIDFTQYGPQIGPIAPLQYTDIREMANNTYVDSVIQQRTELQQRLMHKNSNREWQLRKAPISRQNQARASGGKSNSSGGYAGPRG